MRKLISFYTQKIFTTNTKQNGCCFKQINILKIKNSGSVVDKQNWS